MNSYQQKSSSGETAKDSYNISQSMGEDLAQPPRPLTLGEHSVSSKNCAFPTMPNPAFPARLAAYNERMSSIGSIGSLGDISLPSDFLSEFSGDMLNNNNNDDDDDVNKPTDVPPFSGFLEESLMAPMRSFVIPQAKQVGKSKDEDERTLLHRACQQYPRRKSVIKAALQKDPSAVLRRALIPGSAPQAKAVPKARGSGPEPYQLPINIALSHKASLEVLDLLVKADPSQLSQKDGIQGVNSLCLALEKRPNDVAVLGMFLISNPNLARLPCDNIQNTPLHVACQRGSSLPIIRQLYRLHPASLFQRNEHGKTPLDILQQQALYSHSSNVKASLEYLQGKMALGL